MQNSLNALRAPECELVEQVRMTSEKPNYSVNLTASGASLLPHGNRGGRARVEEVGPLAAGYAER